jgi:pSer/pThr/pTyr-binding forkhead associated (FHA) protein
MLMGRHSDVDIRLCLPDVSRRHCRFLFQGDAWQVFDLNSLNGVFVNGERVQQAVLHDRDVVIVGGFQFTVELPAGPDARAADRTAEANTHAVLQSIAEALPRPDDDAQPER